MESLSALLGARLDHDTHHLDRVAMRHHYFDDLHVGDSTVRFLAAVSELVALRDQLRRRRQRHHRLSVALAASRWPGVA